MRGEQLEARLQAVEADAAEAAIRVAELESELDAVRAELEAERTSWTGAQSA
jgi:protein phosphatase 1 regulatory subunit 37